MSELRPPVPGSPCDGPEGHCWTQPLQVRDVLPGRLAIANWKEPDDAQRCECGVMTWAEAIEISELLHATPQGRPS